MISGYILLRNVVFTVVLECSTNLGFILDIQPPFKSLRAVHYTEMVF